MGIQAAHAYLADNVLTGMEITEPVTARIKRAYRFIPPSRQSLNDVPCAFSTFHAPEVQFYSALQVRPYTIHLMLVAGSTSPDANVAADIAAGLYEALLQRLRADLTLGGTVNHINVVRGESPETLVTLEWGGKLYIAVDLYIDVTFAEAVEYSP